MKETIEEIYKKFSKPLLFFILKNVSNKDLSQDLLHEVFIKAYKNIETLEDKDNIQAWLYKIAQNTITDYFRKKRPNTINNEDMFFEQEDEETILSELSCCLNTLISELPLTQRELLKEVYFNEKTLIEYAEEKKLNLSTVKSHSKRAKDKLKKVFNDCCIFQENSKKEIVDYKYKGEFCICNS